MQACIECVGIEKMATNDMTKTSNSWLKWTMQLDTNTT